MPEPTKLVKAHLIELANLDKGEVKPGGRDVEVQFNPETLKVTYANQVATPQGAGDQKGPSGQQFVGSGSTKLAVQLWFDASVLDPPVPNSDVIALTQAVAYFITAIKNPKDPKQYIVPATSFRWGAFWFDGVVEAMEQSLEFFSADGRPLRASVSLTLSSQKIVEFKSGVGTSGPGTAPFTAAPAGSSMQGLAAAQGQGGNWQAIAAANNIENPRMLAPGQLLDMSAGLSAGASVGVSAGASVGVSAGASLGVSAGASLGVSAGVGASATFGG